MKGMPGMSWLCPIFRQVAKYVISSLMYNHRTPKDRVEVVDLDPYGTAAPFVDAAVQCVSDGGTRILTISC